MQVFMIEVFEKDAWSAEIDGRYYYTGGKMNTTSPKIYASQKSAERGVTANSYLSENNCIVSATLTVDIVPKKIKK